MSRPPPPGLVVRLPSPGGAEEHRLAAGALRTPSHMPVGAYDDGAVSVVDRAWPRDSRGCQTAGGTAQVPHLESCPGANCGEGERWPLRSAWGVLPLPPGDSWSPEAL
ncbi:hypothetical protein NDU88_003355 [Pleurodeles waltl]|uniref:Uncharacterized protein n=1 Tax=Pleurodeles waltl TaxID=8319 RepID=A0AAV7LID9_PLEWA|nr:hypothetical protein NDU88_003355 [Pleurodeles waltl]